MITNRLIFTPKSAFIGLFLLLNFMLPHTGGDNANSRYAMSLAMALHGTFQIDSNYKDLTGDWSQTPDGHYYSNKAPLPAMLGAPVLWVAARFVPADKSDSQAVETYFVRNAATFKMVLSWLTQVIPMAFLISAIWDFLRARRFSLTATMLAVTAMLFANTASVYFNNFFGHGLAAMLVLVTVLCAIEKRIMLSAFFFGATLLSDYATALVLPVLAIMWFADAKMEGPKALLTALLKVVSGASIPGLVWIWYHITCFGSPFTLPNKFQNPAWVDLKNQDDALWVIFHSYPQPTILFELLFGTARGLLWTQPWILFLYGFGALQILKRAKTSVFGSRDFDRVNLFFVSGLTLLLIMNASFGGWHGGLTNGPRYLSPIFLVAALLMAPLWDQGSQWLRRVLAGTLGFAVFYYALGFSQDLQTQMNPWGEYLSGLTSGGHLLRALLSIGLLLGLYRYAHSYVASESQSPSESRP